MGNSLRQILFYLFCFSSALIAISVSENTAGSEETLSQSSRLVDNCWTKGELRGNAGEKKVLRVSSVPAGGGPLRLRPCAGGPELPDRLANSIRSVNTGDKKLLALTFDLCEGGREISGYDNEIVNYLRDHDIKATFFASGKWMRSHPEKTMQLMSDPLFEIGNHGWSHRNLRLLDRKRAEEEILWTQAQYELIWEDLQRMPCVRAGYGNSAEEIPRVPKVFRFPFGTCSSEALGLLREVGLAAIQWDVVSGDAARGQTPSAIADVVLKKAKPGSIIIFHANGRGHGTAASLPIFVPKMIKRGFSFAKVSELLLSGTPVAVPDCYELRPGDNLRYDKLFAK